jgi:hypothetical protein
MTRAEAGRDVAATAGWVAAVVEEMAAMLQHRTQQYGYVRSRAT